MTDQENDLRHRRRAKENYWTIKYREWRPLVLIAPFVTFFLGGFLGFYIGAVRYPRIVTVDNYINRIVEKEVPAIIRAPADNRNKIVTYQDSPCTSTKVTIDLPPRTAVTLPRNCYIIIGANALTAVYETAAPSGSAAVLQPYEIVGFFSARDLIADSMDKAVQLTFIALPYKK